MPLAHRVAREARSSDSIVKQPRIIARLSWRAGCALVRCPPGRGMERWTALARLTDAPGGPPRGRADLRKIRPEITGP